MKRLLSQPRISGVVREHKHSAVHPYIEEGLREIAKEEGKSVSWVIAEIVGDYLGVDAATGKIISINQFTRYLLAHKKAQRGKKRAA